MINEDKILTADEFIKYCHSKGLTNPIEISQRYENYLIGFEGMHDGRTAIEVGACIWEKDLED